jgi:hypothetical protein
MTEVAIRSTKFLQKRYIYVKLQLGFNPVAVVQQYNRQVTQNTHRQSTNTIQQHNNKCDMWYVICWMLQPLYSPRWRREHTTDIPTLMRALRELPDSLRGSQVQKSVVSSSAPSRQHNQMTDKGLRRANALSSPHSVNWSYYGETLGCNINPQQDQTEWQ